MPPRVPYTDGCVAPAPRGGGDGQTTAGTLLRTDRDNHIGIGENVRLDWVIRADRFEHPLTPGGPPHVEATRRTGPTPLQLNVHDGLEVGITLSGEAERHFQDYVIPGLPGDVWLCAMWEPHGRRVTSSVTENVVVIFLPDFLGEEMLGDIPWLSLFAVPAGQRPRVTGGKMRESVLAIGKDLRQEVLTKRRGWETAVRLGLLRLLFALSRDWQPPAPGAMKRATASDLSRIMPVLSAFHAHPERRVTLPEAAAACGLSRSRFALVFHETMGLSFGRFCLRARLAFVAHQLLNTDLAVEDIAEQVGFVDASHLHHAFAKHYGCTPRRYRDLGRGASAKR